MLPGRPAGDFLSPLQCRLPAFRPNVEEHNE